MKIFSIILGVLGIGLLLVGTSATMANIQAGTLARPQNFLLVSGILLGGGLLIAGGITGISWTGTTAAAPAPGVGLPPAAVTPAPVVFVPSVPPAASVIDPVAPHEPEWVFDPLRGATGQFQIGTPTQRDFDALYHLAARSAEAATPELTQQMLGLCRDLSLCLFQLHHGAVTEGSESA